MDVLKWLLSPRQRSRSYLSLSSTRAVDGTRAHQKFQKAQDDEYQSEVSLEHRCHVGGVDFIVACVGAKPTEASIEAWE